MTSQKQVVHSIHTVHSKGVIMEAGAVAAIDNEPIFRSADFALRFAFEYGKDWRSRNSLAQWILDKERKPRVSLGLSGLDGATQAGFILAELGSLEEAEKAALICRYAIRRTECAACGGPTFTEPWREGINELTDYVLQAVTGISPRHMRRRLVERYFGEDVDVKLLAGRFEVSKSTAYNHADAIKTCLGRLEERAMLAAQAALETARIVGFS